MIQVTEKGLSIRDDALDLTFDFETLFGFVLAAMAALDGAPEDAQRTFKLPGDFTGQFWGIKGSGKYTLYLLWSDTGYYKSEMDVSELRLLVCNLQSHVAKTPLLHADWENLPMGRWTGQIDAWEEEDIMLADAFLGLWLTLNIRVRRSESVKHSAYTKDLRMGVLAALFFASRDEISRAKDILDSVVLLIDKVFV